MTQSAADDLLALFARRGNDAYFGERVSQAEHALQSAELAAAAGAAPSLIVAALLHDVGHLIHSAGEDVAERGVDARHEAIGAVHLAKLFGPAVTEPVRLHVAAKRYLCATDPAYRAGLSEASERSLMLQGGPFTANEAEAFLAQPFAREAVDLRRWDDEAKIVGYETRPVEAWREIIIQVLAAHPPAA